MMSVRLFAAAVFLGVASVAQAGAYFSALDRGCDLSDPGVSLFYAKHGHLNTTHAVAMFAGYSYHEAARLACFSQMPDDEALKYSATAVAIWGIPVWTGYRHRVVSVLHSLHGGDNCAVEARRARLEQLVHDEAGKLPTWQLGFLIHAMGDSYAHVWGETGALHAYGEIYGHAFAFDQRPDIISANNNFEQYEKYVRALFKALRRGTANEEGFEAFILRVRAAAQTHRESEVVDAIKAPDSILILSGTNKMAALGTMPAQPYDEVSFAQATDFIRQMSGWIER